MAFLELFLTFFMIGACTFGGGYAMMPLMQEQVGLRWNEIISAQEITDFIAVSESTPGPFAVNMATYIGSEVGNFAGTWGSLFGSFCATMGVILPSFIVILIVAKFYEKYRNSKTIQGIMTGLKPAVVGLIGNAFINVLMTVFFPAGFSLAVFSGISFYIYTAVFAVMLLLAFKKVHPIIIICLSAAIGIAVGYLGI